MTQVSGSRGEVLLHALVSVAELLRRYHEAVTSFEPAGRSWPRPVPAAFGGGLVGHNDPNLDNVVFSGGRADRTRA